MSYTHQVKEEIMQNSYKNIRERDYELFASLILKNSIKNGSIKFDVENISIAKRVYSFLKEVTNLRILIQYSISMRFGEHRVYSVIIPFQKNYGKFIEFLNKIRNDDFIDNESKCVGFIRGCFLVSGYIKHPDKEYALDFFIEEEDHAKYLYDILKKMDKRVSLTKKRNKFLVYLRNQEDIMDILVMSSALKSFFEYEEITLYKEIKNKTIRAINWEVANETKIMDAARKHIKMIKYIDKTIGLDSLTDVLHEIALLRVEHEEVSLQELAEIIGLSKSGVRNRLRRIEKQYEELIGE